MLEINQYHHMSAFISYMMSLFYYILSVHYSSVFKVHLSLNEMVLYNDMQAVSLCYIQNKEQKKKYYFV